MAAAASGGGAGGGGCATRMPGSEWIYNKAFLAKTLTADPSDPGDSFDRTVDAHIKTLRAKLKAVAPDVEPIRTLRGTGYALNEDLPTAT